MEERFPKLSKIITFLADNWHWLLGILGAILIAWSGYMLESASPDESLLIKMKTNCQDLYSILNEKQYKNGKWVLILGILLDIISIVFVKISEVSKSKILIQYNSDIETLKDRINSLSQDKNTLEDTLAKTSKDYYDLLNFKLAKIATKRLSLSENERITVYRHNKDEKSFELISRFSKSPIYCEPDRKIYKDDQGFIAIGWQNGKYTRDGFPRFEKNEAAYITAIRNECKIPKDVLNNINMKSSSFYINTIKDTSNVYPIAIIVIESKNPKGLDFNAINNSYKEISIEIQHDLEALKRLEPSLTIAKNKGL
ncbi:hypothetical protein GCM10008015_18130 [Flavobacterium palustre]|uniref:GAF domain-containing protein n=1 Tax=Flavobacterium palustre TaxID=1476463 RepID=A0ABQ1HIS9_9FLAO|nr:hypothetical protein [Flavobacterium palustre]GGA77849.1 hypothetical protein GCM10008015_18130 [Flavobacterium palustre]